MCYAGDKYHIILYNATKYSYQLIFVITMAQVSPYHRLYFDVDCCVYVIIQAEGEETALVVLQTMIDSMIL